MNFPALPDHHAKQADLITILKIIESNPIGKIINKKRRLTDKTISREANRVGTAHAMQVIKRLNTLNSQVYELYYETQGIGTYVTSRLWLMPEEQTEIDRAAHDIREKIARYQEIWRALTLFELERQHLFQNLTSGQHTEMTPLPMPPKPRHEPGQMKLHDLLTTLHQASVIKYSGTVHPKAIEDHDGSKTSILKSEEDIAYFLRVYSFLYGDLHINQKALQSYLPKLPCPLSLI